MASLYSLNKSQLESLKREQLNAIQTHKQNSLYSSNQTNCNNILKRLQLKLSELELALSKFN